MNFDAFSARRLTKHVACLRRDEVCIPVIKNDDCRQCYDAALCKLVLRRVSDTEYGMFGNLLDGGIPIAVTLERPWRLNKKDISCIPAGEYMCQRTTSPAHGETFQVLEVPNRANILFHVGNTVSNTAGCVLIGRSFGRIDGTPGVQFSRDGFDLFMANREGIAEFLLEVVPD